MSERKERYVRLAPMAVDKETRLAVLASEFFSGINYREVCRIVDKTAAEDRICPMSGRDFMVYLEKVNAIEEPDRYIYQIRHLLERMAANNILVEMVGTDQGYVMMPKSYYRLSEVSNMRGRGVLWLAKTLGGRFVHRQVSPAVVHIVGKDAKGDERGGSGIVFDARHVLTCRHVVADMTVDQVQRFQGKDVTLDEEGVFEHEEADVAVVRVREALTPVAGLVFLSPAISQTVYRFGYARVPCAIPLDTGESPLTMQSGEVNNASVRVFGGTELFLYSATARPGDSGGPIVSDDGYVVGMSTELTDGRYDGEDVFSPHYAGIPSQVVANAVRGPSAGGGDSLRDLRVKQPDGTTGTIPRFVGLRDRDRGHAGR